MLAVDRARTWVRAHALPLWAEQGVDKVRGGFHERLRPDGTPDETVARRARVQARQIYVYCHAHALGWFDGERLAGRALDLLVERAWKADGAPGWGHLLTPDGELADPKRDAYDHAFFLFALAWHHKVTGDAQSLGLARETLAFMDEAMAAPTGGYVEALPPALPRRQNPHMHLLEAFLALHDASGDSLFLDRARSMKQLFDTAFFDRGKRALREYFSDGWTPAEGAAGRMVEPGHHMEWVWLLSRFDAATGEDNSAAATALYDFALENGVDAASGFLVDEIDVDGAVVRATRRSWPQTELIKAAAVMHEAGRSGAAALAASALDGMLGSYLDAPAPGGWIDQFDADGSAMSEFMPASTFYHVFCAIAEADRVFGASGSNQEAVT